LHQACAQREIQPRPQAAHYSTSSNDASYDVQYTSVGINKSNYICRLQSTAGWHIKMECTSGVARKVILATLIFLPFFPSHSLPSCLPVPFLTTSPPLRSRTSKFQLEFGEHCEIPLRDLQKSD